MSTVFYYYYSLLLVLAVDGASPSYTQLTQLNAAAKKEGKKTGNAATCLSAGRPSPFLGN